MTDKQHSDKTGHSDGQSHDKKMYLRFGAMILTAMVVMYAVMFVSSWQWSHIRFSESRVFMALTMGGAMGLIMLGYMLNMYRNTKANLCVIAASLLLLGGGVFLAIYSVAVFASVAAAMGAYFLSRNTAGPQDREHRNEPRDDTAAGP